MPRSVFGRFAGCSATRLPEAAFVGAKGAAAARGRQIFPDGDETKL
jgi:hypothetical protein